MSGHTIVLLPGSERRFRSLDEIEELCLAPFEKGQSSVEVSTCVIDAKIVQLVLPNSREAANESAN